MGTISYNSQLVMTQFGYNKSVIQLTGAMGCLNALTVKEKFVGEGIEHVLANFQSVFWPDKTRVGVRSPGGSIYWKKNSSTMIVLILSRLRRL